MHFKLFLSFLVLGVCTASLYGEKFIKVNHDGSYCEIISENGLKIDLIKNKYEGSYGIKDFEVVLSGPNFYKTFHINNQIAGDVLCDLCVRYQGVVDDLTFEKLLYKVEHYVQQGDVHPKVFYMFKSLNDRQALQYLINDETYGDDYFYGIYGKTFQGPYGKYFNQDKYALYGDNYYPTFQGPYGVFGKYFHQNKYGLYGDNYYPYTGYQGKWYGHLFGQGYQTPYNWENVFYKTQYPFAGKYYTGNQYGLQTLFRNPVEKEIEREVEQEVEKELLVNQLTNKYYGQVTPFLHETYSQKYFVPRTQQIWGTYPYGRQGLFGGYFGRF